MNDTLYIFQSYTGRYFTQATRQYDKHHAVMLAIINTTTKKIEITVNQLSRKDWLEITKYIL